MAETIEATVNVHTELITATVVSGSETITAIVNADPRGPVGGGGGSADLPIASQDVVVDAVVVSGFAVQTDYNGVYVRAENDGSGRGRYTNGQGAWLTHSQTVDDVDVWGFGTRLWVYPIAYAPSTSIYPWEAPSTAWLANTEDKDGDGPPTVTRATMIEWESASVRFSAGKLAPTTRNATAGELVTGSDTRLTNARTPTAHAASHATGGADEITPAAIGAATAAQGALAATAQQPYLCRSDHDGTYLYIGTAAVGTAESAAAWTIKRQLFSGTSTITTTTATGVAWTDRLEPTTTYT